MLNDIISKKLKGLRAENSMTLDDVAKHLNIHRETLRRYENNPLKMDMDTYVKLLNLYKKDVSIFFEEVYGKMS